MTIKKETRRRTKFRRNLEEFKTEAHVPRTTYNRKKTKTELIQEITNALIQSERTPDQDERADPGGVVPSPLLPDH